MFERILVPLDHSPLAGCVLPQAIALSRHGSSQLIPFHVLSLPARQDRLQRLPAMCSQARPALPHLTL